jgi:hypothetical protein
MEDVAVVVVAVFFAGMGILGLARPEDVVGRFGTILPGVDARNEVGAVYGGFGLAVAAILGTALAGGDTFRDGVLAAVAVSLVGMATGRLVGFALERPDSWASPTVLFLAVELGLAGLLGVGISG